MAQVSQTKQAKEDAVAAGKVAPPTTALEVVPKIKANALSLDIGPKVIAIFDRSAQEQDKGHELLNSAQGKKYEGMSLLTQGIMKAAMNDQTIKLSDAFSGDRKKMEHLMKQLGLALGFREVQTQKDGDKNVERVVVAKAVAKYFPGPNEDTKSPEYQRKNTFRANFGTTVKNCAQAAEGLILSKATVKFDADNGTLRLSGPKIKEHFGADDVLLNENASQKGKEKDAQLAHRPSFTEIRALAGEEHGAAVHRGTNTRGTQVGATAPKAVDPEAALVSLCHMLIQSIGKFDGPVPVKVREAFGQVVNTINEKMKETA
jgi:hypothetical protein